MAGKIQFKHPCCKHVSVFILVPGPFFCCLAPAPVSVDAISGDDGHVFLQCGSHTLSSVGDFQFIFASHFSVGTRPNVFCLCPNLDIIWSIYKIHNSLLTKMIDKLLYRNRKITKMHKNNLLGPILPALVFTLM